MVSPLAETSAIQSMSSSKYKLLRRWSTPTVPNYKIHGLFKESDQRRWVYTCPHCGKEQWMDYTKNVKQVGPDSGIDRIHKVVLPGTFDFVCQYCSKPLDRWYGGRWVATSPHQGATHGYSISQMDAVWISASHLKQEELKAQSKQTFYNYVLGLPYEDSSVKFYASDVTNNMSDYDRPKDRLNYKYVSAGIDWGQHYHHLVIMGITPEGNIELMDLKRFARSVGVEHIEEDLNQMIREINKYQPDIILPDIGYSGNYVDLLKKYYGMSRVYGVKVRSAKSNGDPQAHFSDNEGTVTLDKLTQNMIMLANMRRGDIRFWRKMDEDLSLFITHWGNVIIRTDEEQNQATKEIELIKRITRKGDDHYSQASVYSMVGLTHLLNLESQSAQMPLRASFLEDTLGTPDQTDIIKELDIGNTFNNK